jgi:tetratricopeptide (TPR) repeat protein
MYHAPCYASRPMSVRRHFKHAMLLLLSVGCAEPGASSIGKGNRAARDGHFEEAVAAFQQACTEAPQLARAHALLGNALWASGKSPEALAAWSQALKLDPGQLDAALGLARHDLQTGATAAAIDRLDGALLRAPSRSDLRTARALALIRRNAEGDVAKANEDSEAAFRASPKDPDVLYTRGSVLIAAHRFNEAQSTLDALERASPRSPLAPYGLARLAAAQSRKTDVMLHLRAARSAAGSTWQPEPVAADPAFAFLKDDPDFVREVSGR